MKIVRDYLTSQEMIDIVNTLIQEENAVAREVIKVGLVVQYLCDDLGEYNNCNDLYDSYMQESFDLELEIKNYNDIDYLVQEELGVAKTVRDLVKVLGDKIKDINIDALSQQLIDMKEVTK